jgi:hypothetical protein
MMRRLVLSGALLVALGGSAGAQLRGVRFDISQVTDTTILFRFGTATWVRSGLTGIAVDPRRRDALVARFRVIAVDTAFATALVTGQTTRPATEHVAVLDEPGRPWYRTALFWGGVVLGFAVGAVVGGQF